MRHFSSGLRTSGLRDQALAKAEGSAPEKLGEPAVDAWASDEEPALATSDLCLRKHIYCEILIKNTHGIQKHGGDFRELDFWSLRSHTFETLKKQNKKHRKRIKRQQNG